MLKISRSIAVALIATGLCSVAAAQGFDNRRLFFGGGLSQNSVFELRQRYGFQIFGGYNFPAIARNFYVDARSRLHGYGQIQEDAFPSSVPSNEGQGAVGVRVARYMVAPQWELLAASDTTSATTTASCSA